MARLERHRLVYSPRTARGNRLTWRLVRLQRAWPRRFVVRWP